MLTFPCPSTFLHRGIAAAALLSPFIISNAVAEVVKGEADMYITFSLDECVRGYDSDFSRYSDWSYPVNNKDATEFGESGVTFYIVTYGDMYTKDFGFYSEDTQFSICGYTDRKPKYVESIEVDWSDKVEYGGNLQIYTRGEDQGAFTAKSSYATLLKGAGKGDVIDCADANAEGKTRYTFSEPFPYIALVYSNDGDNRLARFKSFTLHFINEWNQGENGTTTGVSTVGNCYPEATYFDLSGRQVDINDNIKGIFIKRSGNKSEKIIL